MKRKHSGNIVIHHHWCENTWWLRLIRFFFQISKTKWNGADQTRWRTHLIALHTHTPLPALDHSPSPVGMDIWMNRWRTVGFVEWFYQLFTQLQTQLPSNTVLAHKHAHKRLIQASNEPGCRKTIDAPLSPAQTPLALVRVQMSATHPKTKIPTRAIHYLWHREKDKKKQGRFWNATSWLFGGANLFYLM